MYVRQGAEVPDEAGAFESPEVPADLVGRAVVLVEGDVAVAAQGQVMAAEHPGERILTFRLPEEHRAATLERAAGIPLAVPTESLERFVIGQDRPQRPLDQVLLRLGVGIGDSLLRAERR